MRHYLGIPRSTNGATSRQKTLPRCLVPAAIVALTALLGLPSQPAGLGSAGVGTSEAGASTSDPLNPRCMSRTVAVAGARRALEFRVRCNFRLSYLRVDPDRRFHRVRRSTEVRNDGGEGRFRCSTKRPNANAFILCRGSAPPESTVTGRFRSRAHERCRIGTRFEMHGGVACDPGQACPAVLLGKEKYDPKPSGC